MKKIIEKLNTLSHRKKVQLVVAVLLTICFIAMIPVYAWFSNQKNTAEMFKIKYPNSLFINAAHREDRKFFSLDEIDVKEEINNVPTLSKLYVFSVSGESTNEFILQMAHTNNNGFEYKIYEATELPSDAGADISYELHGNAADPDAVAPNENKPENTLDFDEVVASNAYYSKGAAVSGEYKNLINNSDSTKAKKDSNDQFYFATYGEDLKVHADSVPTYWQADITTNLNPNTKQFCKYFILEVSWTVNHVNNKETDLIYLAVTRKS